MGGGGGGGGGGLISIKINILFSDNISEILYTNTISMIINLCNILTVLSLGHTRVPCEL